jgi:hypothetical protein
MFEAGMQAPPSPLAWLAPLEPPLDPLPLLELPGPPLLLIESPPPELPLDPLELAPGSLLQPKKEAAQIEVVAAVRIDTVKSLFWIMMSLA